MVELLRHATDLETWLEASRDDHRRAWRTAPSWDVLVAMALVGIRALHARGDTESTARWMQRLQAAAGYPIPGGSAADVREAEHVRATFDYDRLADELGLP